MPFLSPMGRYAIATKAERKQIDALNKLLDKEEDKQMQIVRDEMMENGLLD
jgi:hypothetical protein